MNSQPNLERRPGLTAGKTAERSPANPDNNQSRCVVIPGPIVGQGRDRLPPNCVVVNNPEALMTQPDFEQVMHDAWGVLSMVGLKVNRQVIDGSPRLKIISHIGVGYDCVDSEYAASKGIIVTNTPGVLTESTAEMGFALLMATARRIVEGDALIRATRFKRPRLNLMLGSELHGKTLGVLGCGRIGQAVARMASGFSLRVIYHNRNRLSPEIEANLQLTRVDFDQLLAESDFIIITAPLNEQTKHLFTFDSFQQMKKSATLVNIGRGGIIKESDLVAALKQGLIRAAALDVLEFPPNTAAGLTSLDNVILTPHIGSATVEARTRMCDIAVDAIVDVYHGRKPRFKVAG